MIHSKRLQYGNFSYTVKFSKGDYFYLMVRDLSAKTRVRTRRGGRLVVTRIKGLILNFLSVLNFKNSITKRQFKIVNF